ncbi:MurR/RpiR family transcriptional regulator HpxU [soil metagenome]
MTLLDSSLAERLAAAYTELSPQEQRAADFLRDHLADLAIYNATEVARLSGVSKATVSRLYRRLGFESAEELRDHVRALRNTGTPLATTASVLDVQLEQEFANLRAAFAGLDLTPAATAIANARRVLVIGFRNSYPMALHLRQQLAQARGGVEIAPSPGQTVGEELADLTAADVVVLFGFRRRPQQFAALVETLEKGPAALILVTDAGGRRFAAGAVSNGATHLIECPIDSAAAFDSYAAVASVISALAAAVLGLQLASGGTRIAEIGGLYRDLGELEL